MTPLLLTAAQSACGQPPHPQDGSPSREAAERAEAVERAVAKFGRPARWFVEDYGALCAGSSWPAPGWKSRWSGPRGQRDRVVVAGLARRPWASPSAASPTRRRSCGRPRRAGRCPSWAGAAAPPRAVRRRGAAPSPPRATTRVGSRSLSGDLAAKGGAAVPATRSWWQIPEAWHRSLFTGVLVVGLLACLRVLLVGLVACRRIWRRLGWSFAPGRTHDSPQ